MDEENNIKALLEDKLLTMGYTLAEVHYSLSKNGPLLQIVIDKDEPISLDDIVLVSDKISSLLDEEDPIDGPYTLDVSSLGAEKPIPVEKLPHYVGKYVHLHLSHPYQGENILEGKLEKIENENVTLILKIKGKKKTILFPLNTIDKARLAIEF